MGNDKACNHLIKNRTIIVLLIYLMRS